jgi:TRAP transporter TAXI family solute receptor
MRLIGCLAAVLLALSACDRAPSSEAVARDLAARLSAAFGDAFEITEVSRRGAAKDITAAAGESRRIVYFDAALRARRDIDLGTWDTPGAASLVSLLGAGPKGLYGINSDGNKAGDVIRVHGSALYREEASAWRNVAAAGFQPPKAPVTDNQAPRPVSERLIAALQATIRSLPAGTTPASNAIIEDELQRAVNNIQARLSRAEDGIAMAAGPEQGQYLRIVRALRQQTAKERKPRVTPLVTAGSVENLKLLREGKVLLALAQGDIAALAFAGTGPFADQGPHSTLRALGSLYLEPLHVIVLRDSPVRTIADLAGRRVNIGAAGSGSRVTALDVLAAHGLAPDRLSTLGELALTPALAALRDGRIEAVIEVIGVPANEIRNAFATLPLRLVPLEPGAVDSLIRQSRAYIAAHILPGAYASLDAPVPTVGVAAILATTTDLTAAEAAFATRLVYTATGLVEAGSPQGAQVNLRTARAGVTIPMHEGAERALAELKAR